MDYFPTFIGRIPGIDFDDENKIWQIKTNRGVFSTKKLVVAVPPWEVSWLPKNFWPPKLLNLIIKTRPVSAVVLCEKLIDIDSPLPSTIFVPSEKSQIIIERDEICYQSTLHHELSLQAPAVVKAVRRLKRARKKLHAARPDLKAEGEHLALIPAGWAQPVAASEHKWPEKLAKQDFQTPNLAFCGDAYGDASLGDTNIINSVVSGLDQILLD